MNLLLDKFLKGVQNVSLVHFFLCQPVFLSTTLYFGKLFRTSSIGAKAMEYKDKHPSANRHSQKKKSTTVYNSILLIDINLL